MDFTRHVRGTENHGQCSCFGGRILYLQVCPTCSCRQKCDERLLQTTFQSHLVWGMFLRLCHADGWLQRNCGQCAFQRVSRRRCWEASWKICHFCAPDRCGRYLKHLTRTENVCLRYNPNSRALNEKRSGSAWRYRPIPVTGWCRRHW